MSPISIYSIDSQEGLDLQDLLFKQENKKFSFEILRAQDPLLLNALEGFPHELEHLPPIPRKEAWYRGSRGMGGIFLTVLARSLFCVQRYPGYGDRTLSPLSQSFLRVKELTEGFFAKVKQSDIERSLYDLKRLYEHTQYVLQTYTDRIAHVGKVEFESNRVRLFRGVKWEYAQKIVFLCEKAKEEGKNEFRIQTDTLAAYSTVSGYKNGGVIYEVEVPIKNILIWSETVALSGYEKDLHSPEEEWIVVNTHPKGELIIRVNDVKTNGYEAECLREDIKNNFPLWKKRYENHYISLESARIYPFKHGPIVSQCVRIERLLKKLRLL